MNPAHLHLALNHVPVIGVVFAVLLLGYALLRNSREVIRTGLVALVFVAVIAIPVFLTGEPAEEIAENLPGVSEAIIGQHESFAKYALGAAIFSGVAAFVSLMFSFWNERLSNWLAAATLLLALVTGALMLAAANLGGQIRHTEIRDTAAAVQPEQQNQQEGEKEDDDDR